jgi:hypothetical protein
MYFLKAILAVIALTGAAVALIGLCRQTKNPPKHMALKVSLASPGNRYRANCYTAPAGGAGNVWEVVNIQTAAEESDEKKGVIFAIVGAGGVDLEWSAVNTLVIHHPAGSRDYARKRDLGRGRFRAH